AGGDRTRAGPLRGPSDADHLGRAGLVLHHRLPERVAGAVPEGRGASGARCRPLRGGGRARTHHPLGARVPLKAPDRMTVRVILSEAKNLAYKQLRPFTLFRVTTGRRF